MAKYDIEIDPKKFEAGADKITQAIKEMARSGQAAGEQLDAAFEDIDYDKEAEKVVAAQRKQKSSAKSLEKSVRAVTDAYKELAAAGNRLTKIQEQERRQRITNEKQGQQEVSRILTSASKDREAAERSSFQRNRQLRDDNTKQSQTSAKIALDALFTSSNQQNNIRAERAKRDAKIEQDLEKEIKRVTRSASNAFKKQASEINRARRLIEVGMLELFFTLHSLSKPVNELTNALADFTAGNVKAAAEVQKYASTLNIVSGNSATAKRVLDSLLDVTVELAAIDTPGLIQFSARLQHAGFTAQQAENSIVGVTKRMEEQGKGAGITNRVLEQFSQAINADLISMQDFRPILREYPGLYKDFSTALGTTITDMDSLRAAADQAGGATKAIAIALEHVSTVAQGAELDTINRQLDEFKDRIFNLQRALGDVLLPNLVQLLKIGNRFLDLLQNMGETARVFTQVLALMAFGIGKAVEGFIQFGIISVVVIQIRTAVTQINSAAQSLNNLAAVANNTTAAVVGLPKDFQRVSSVMSTLQRILPAIAIGFAAILVLVPFLTALFAKITQQVRLARQEIKDFNSVQRQIPKSINEGSAAIKSQIKDLREYRLDLQKTRDELAKIINFTQSRDPFANMYVRRDSSSILVKNIAILTGGVDRLKNLNSQIESITENIRQLLIIGNEDLEISTRLFQLVGIIENLNKQIALARIDEAFGVEDAADKVRRLTASLLEVQNAFRTISEEAGKVDAIANYAEELIKIDFAIRRLERTAGDFDAEDLVDKFGAFRADDVIRNTQETIRQLNKEAEFKIKLAKEESEDEKKLALDILKINEQLAFDLENLELKSQKRIDEIHELSSKKRFGRISRYLKFEQAAAEARIQAEKKWKEFVDSIDKRVNDGRRERRLKDAAEVFVNRRKERDLVLEGVRAFALLDDRVQDFYRNSNTNVLNHIEIQTLVKTKIDETTESVIDLTKNLIDQLDVYSAFRKESDETELFKFQTPKQGGLSSGLPQIPRNVPTTPLDPEGLTDQFGRVLELAELIEKESRSIISANNRIIKQFSRGISRSLTDFVFEGKETFSEFLLEFSKVSFRIIVQSRIQAEIQKRVSDDLTRHQIVNIQKVAAAQIAAGNTATSLGTSGLAALSPVASILSSGVGTAVLIGLSIAPFLVRAIKEGFDDTSVNIDKREVGKVSASSVGRLVREGKVRL